MRRERIAALDRKVGRAGQTTAMFHLEADFSGTADIWIPPRAPDERSPAPITRAELIALLEGEDRPGDLFALQGGRWFNEDWNQALERYVPLGWCKGNPTLLEAARGYRERGSLQDNTAD